MKIGEQVLVCWDGKLCRGTVGTVVKKHNETGVSVFVSKLWSADDALDMVIKFKRTTKKKRKYKYFCKWTAHGWFRLYRKGDVDGYYFDLAEQLK